VDLKREFGETGLQVIVKLANIYLTSDKPRYGGGTWHVEGQLVRVLANILPRNCSYMFISQNEHICATALYYYDSDNITESRLSFRQQTADTTRGNIQYEQWHYNWLQEVFGCEQAGPTVQYVGDVITKEGRLLTFPNVFQHRVEPFELLDKSNPGHRKILALFLVDPHIRIISSANVPCQQRDWWAQSFMGHGQFRRLPAEMQAEIMSHVDDFPIGIEEAKELRLELMEERKAFVQRHEGQFTSEVFSLCEH
jgi:hypothetical protein